MKDGSADVKKHRWFREIKWDDVLGRKLKVNFCGIPETSSFAFQDQEMCMPCLPNSVKILAVWLVKFKQGIEADRFRTV